MNVIMTKKMISISDVGQCIVGGNLLDNFQGCLDATGWHGKCGSCGDVVEVTGSTPFTCRCGSVRINDLPEKSLKR